MHPLPTFRLNTLAVGGTGTTSISATGALTIQTLTGILKATAGLVSTATPGTDYENPLTFTLSAHAFDQYH